MTLHHAVVIYLLTTMELHIMPILKHQLLYVLLTVEVIQSARFQGQKHSLVQLRVRPLT